MVVVPAEADDRRMERYRRTAITLGAAISFAGCLAALVGANDTKALAGVMYGVPATALIAGFVTGSRSARRPQLDGALVAEVGFALACMAMLATAPPGYVGALFLLGNAFTPWAFGAMGGGIGGAFERFVQSLHVPS